MYIDYETNAPNANSHICMLYKLTCEHYDASMIETYLLLIAIGVYAVLIVFIAQVVTKCLVKWTLLIRDAYDGPYLRACSPEDGGSMTGIVGNNNNERTPTTPISNHLVTPNHQFTSDRMAGAAVDSWNEPLVETVDPTRHDYRVRQCRLMRRRTQLNKSLFRRYHHGVRGLHGKHGSSLKAAGSTELQHLSSATSPTPSKSTAPPTTTLDRRRESNGRENLMKKQSMVAASAKKSMKKVSIKEKGVVDDDLEEIFDQDTAEQLVNVTCENINTL